MHEKGYIHMLQFKREETKTLVMENHQRESWLALPTWVSTCRKKKRKLLFLKRKLNYLFAYFIFHLTPPLVFFLLGYLSSGQLHIFIFM